MLISSDTGKTNPIQTQNKPNFKPGTTRQPNPNHPPRLIRTRLSFATFVAPFPTESAYLAPQVSPAMPG